MDIKEPMARPMTPDEIRAITETPLRQVSSPVARRRPLSGRIAGAVVGVGLALGLAGISAIPGESDIRQQQAAAAEATQMQESAKAEADRPDAWNSGTYRIEITDQLNIRNAPFLEDNTVDWKNIIAIGGKNITGATSFNVDKPFIKTGQSLSEDKQNGEWFLLDARVKNGNDVVDETLFVAKAPQTIDSGFVQVLKSGTTLALSRSDENDLLEAVTINR